MKAALKRISLCAFLLCSISGARAGEAGVPDEALAKELASAFQDAQSDRLLRSGGRDDLIASALLSFSPGGASAPAFNDSGAAARLAKEFASDRLALYVLALLCHRQKSPCLHPEYRQRLLELDPDNAIHWLIVPAGGELQGTDLQRAAEATLADSHFSAMLGIVRQSLEGQGPGAAAPEEWRGSAELGLMLRRNEVGRVPWPDYTQTMAACSAQAAQSAGIGPAGRNCASLGKLLFEEHGNNIVTRSIGSSLLRRFSKDTPQAESAIAFRRQYVWMSEKSPESRSPEEKERLNEEEVLLGEWEAYQRSAERSGISREPPSDWKPQRPELLLLQEERTGK